MPIGASDNGQWAMGNGQWATDAADWQWPTDSWRAPGLLRRLGWQGEAAAEDRLPWRGDMQLSKKTGCAEHWQLKRLLRLAL